MTSPLFSSLSASQALDLLQQIGGDRVADLSDILTLEVYKLRDGRILSVDWEGGKNAGALWSSENAMRSALDAESMQSGAQHVLKGCDAGARTFIDRIDRHLAAATSVFGIQAEDVISSPTALAAADRAAVRLGWEALGRDPGLSCMMAITGEVIRRAVNGKWRAYPVGGGVWEPWIVDPMNSRYCPFGELCDLIHEQFQDITIDRGPMYLSVCSYLPRPDHGTLQ